MDLLQFIAALQNQQPFQQPTFIQNINTTCISQQQPPQQAPAVIVIPIPSDTTDAAHNNNLFNVEKPVMNSVSSSTPQRTTKTEVKTVSASALWTSPKTIASLPLFTPSQPSPVVAMPALQSLNPSKSQSSQSSQSVSPPQHTMDNTRKGSNANITKQLRYPILVDTTKQHACNVCFLAFSYRRDMMTHKQIHKYERPFVCTICNTSYRSQNAQKCHMKQQHPMVWETIKHRFLK
eukprot:184597_1